MPRQTCPTNFRGTAPAAHDANVRPTRSARSDVWPPPAPRPLRILEVVNEFPPTTGGSETHNTSEVDFLCRRGHDVCVLVPRYRELLGTHQYEEETLRLLEREQWTWSSTHRVPVYETEDRGRASTLSLARMYRRLSRMHGPFDVVVAHRSHYLPSFPTARRLILTLHYMELACPNFMDAPLCSMRPDGGCDCFGQRSWWRNVKWGARRWVSERLADAIVTKYPIIAEKLVTSGLDAEKVRLVRNWVDVSSFDGKRRRWSDMPVDFVEWIDAAGSVFVFLGRLIRDHGATLAVEAFLAMARQRPDARLVVIGDGLEGPALRRRVDEAGLNDRVCFLGWVQRDDVPAVLSWCDYGLATSDWDNYHWRLLEMMAAGLGIVAVDAGDTSAVIADGVTGYLCGPTVSETAAALTRAASQHADAARMGQAARARILKDFSPDNLLDYEAILAGGAK